MSPATGRGWDDEAMGRNAAEQLLLGEWACLGILYQGPTHGFAIASRLKPGGDIGRVWSLSRPLTYRSLEQLTVRGHVHPIGEERGIAGGNRTILAATRRGRAALRTWLATPVPHLRDLRSELLLKLVLAEQCGIDTSAMLVRQREQIAAIAAAIDAQVSDADGAPDVVALWRDESSDAALRFIDKLEPQVRGRSR
jgi:DNA-binding PadR family transcriptional regulator